MADPAISELLASLRIATAFHVAGRLRVPFAVRIVAEQVPVFHHVAVGRARMTIEGETEALVLEQGDFVLFRSGPTRVVADAPGRIAADITTLADIRREAGACIFDHGGAGPESIVVGCGLSVEGVAARFVLRSLPSRLLIRRDQIGPAFATQLAALREEAEAAEGASAVLVTRSTEIVFLQALRWYLREHAQDLRGWFAALHDRRLLAALVQIHTEPATAWTLDGLARVAGMSRSSFSAAFSATVGSPPRAYLTSVRMELATTLLQDSTRALSEIAERVGYRSEPAFITAFKRYSGFSPGEYRKRSG